MAHIEPMDVDSISNDFDDKENLSQNSNVLPRTPSTEKGYEELDVSELNMKLRYSMTPATSPMSRSFTANCRESKVCDNENNLINTMFNDNSNLSHSFNSTITDSIFKSSKFPLQALSTEQFVDDNGNPINRSLDLECNNVTITINGNDNIDDNLSLPSTSSSLAHTPEATTPTKEIVKDGGSPIMRGLKSVLNMFRSSQSPIPSDDIITSDLSTSECKKKEDQSNITTNMGSTLETASKNKEKITKTNSPLKESLVFNEDLEKELRWKDETTILFKEEKIPVYKLFFPSNPTTLEDITSRPLEKENMNSTVEYMDGSLNESVNVDKDTTKVIKLSCLESETLSSPESDSEFVDCETSYSKNDTEILVDDIPTLAPIIENISPVSSITNENTFQPNEIVEANNSLSVEAGTGLANETHEIISNINDVIKGVDIDENFKQNCYNDFLLMKETLNQVNILSNSQKEDNPNDSSDKGNTIVYKNVSLVQCTDETINLEKNSETIDCQINKEHKNDIVNTSDIVDNNASVCEKVKEDNFKEFYPSHITKEIEKKYSGELGCNFDSPIVSNEHTFETQIGIPKINNIKLPLNSQVVNELNIDLGALQDWIVNMDQNIPLVECEKVFNVNNNCNVKIVSEIIKDTILNEKHTNVIDIFPDQDIHLDSKETEIFNNSLPSDIPLPYDSDIDKDKQYDTKEKKLKENDKSDNFPSKNFDFNLSYPTDSIKQSVDGNTSLAERHIEVISYPPISESDNLKTEINNTDKCIPTELADIKEVSSKTFDSAMLPINNNYSVNGIDLDVLTHYAKYNQNVYLQNDDEFVKKRKSTHVEDEVVSTINVEVQYNDVTLSSTNNQTLVTGTELDVFRYDSEDSENPFKTRNKLVASFEVQHCDSVSRDVFLQNHVESISRNAHDIRDKYDEIDIPLVNTSVIEMDLDVPKHDSDNGENLMKSRNIDRTPLEITGGSSDVESIIGTKSIESGHITLTNKCEITIKTGEKIREEVSIPSTFDVSLVTAMDLDVSMPVLEERRNLVDVKEQFESSPERKVRESVIENVTAKKYFENISVDDHSDITTPNNYKVNEVRSTYGNEAVTEMELDVSKLSLEDSGNPINIKEQQQQRQSSLEQQACESVIENVNTTKCFDDYKEITSENDFKNNEVISIPTMSNNSLNEMEIDVSKHVLIASENLIKPSTHDRDIEDSEMVKNNFENILTLPKKITSESDVPINNESILPFTTKTSSEIDVGVFKYEEEQIETTFKTKGFIPSSSNISSKLTQDCYSIHCDEINDPLTTSTESLTSKPNRREILYDQKIFNVLKESTSASLCVSKDNMIVNSCDDNQMNQELYVKDGEKQDYLENNVISAPSTSDKFQDNFGCCNPQDCSFLGQTEHVLEDTEVILSNKIKISSSSSEIHKSKNVFNLPEINDMNFNPFETTSKVANNQKSSSEVCFNPLEQTNINSGRTGDETINVHDLEPNLSSNLSNVTCSSKNTDDIKSLREVHTEDEDTIEGPFLEAHDLSDIAKVADFETEKDMMNFEDLPKHTDDANDNGEFFIDAEAFEFLLNQNKSNVVADSGKESLFLKFDPLFAKRISSDGVLAALNKIQKRQSTPKKLTPLKIMHEENPAPGTSSTTPVGLTAPVARDIVEEPVALSKPMMVVNPAIASIVSPKQSVSPARVNRRSLTFTSPAMAVIDRLLSLSGNSASLDQDSSLPTSREHNETDYALTQLRELLAEKEIHVHNLRSESKELKERFAILDSQVRSLEAESEERLRKVKELNDNLAEKNKINKSMAIVVEEYERTIASLIAEMEQEKKHNAEERMKLISERDEQTAHLASMEVSFSDLHSKYEKSKQIILSMKANEDTYKKSLNEFEVNLLKMQTNYDLLKQHATSKLNHANQELEKYNRAHDAEVLKLNAMIKRKELHITSLEESLSQKTKANEELTAICDELINKVG